MTELINFYSINKKQLLFNLIDVLKSTTKIVKKRKKKKKVLEVFLYLNIL
jgi:hypothetical protein